MFRITASNEPGADLFAPLEEEISRLAIAAAACGPISAVPVLGGACIDAVNKGVQKVQEEWGRWVDNDSTGVLKEVDRGFVEFDRARQRVFEGVWNVAEGFVGGVIDAVGDLFGGRWESVTPPNYGPTYTAVVNGDTLYVDWDSDFLETPWTNPALIESCANGEGGGIFGGIDCDNLPTIAINERLTSASFIDDLRGMSLTFDRDGAEFVLDGPDYVTNEVVARRDGGLFTSSKETRANILHNNELRVSTEGLTRVVVNGTEFDDVFVTDDSLTTRIVIDGNEGDDTLSTGGGDDEIIAGPGNDIVYSGAGDDVVRGEDGNDRLLPGLGDDMTFGGAGDDEISEYVATEQVRIAEENYIYAGPGNDRVWGSSGVDVVYGDTGRDVILTYGGGDFIYSGPDVIPGGYDADAEADIVDAGGGNDTIRGGVGNDNIRGGDGTDTIFGLADNDVLRGDGFWDSGGNQDFIYGGSGQDHIFGGGGDDRLFGEGDADFISGGFRRRPGRWCFRGGTRVAARRQRPALWEWRRR